MGLIEALAYRIADPRDPTKTTHDLRSILVQRIYGIAMGYEDGNDHHTLRTDSVFQILADKAPDPDDPLASPSTISRLENAVSRESLVAMTEVLVDQFIKAHRRAPKELILDFDASAYVLLSHLRRVGLTGTELAKAQVTTIPVEAVEDRRSGDRLRSANRPSPLQRLSLTSLCSPD